MNLTNAQGWLLLLPLIGGLLSFISKRSPGAVATTILGLGFVGSFTFFSGIKWVYSWFWLADFPLTFQVDRLSALLIVLVFFVSLMVHLYSMFYMAHDESKQRYFFLLGFFTSSMLGLLAADSLILLFIFWELVGFSSYLLIGFWNQDAAKASSAKIAFMVNRVADAFLLIAIILLISSHHLTRLSQLSVSEPFPFLVSLFLVIGAFGKSAQFPFSAWLNRAMAGPTPVSALIHAATMVTAGVYLLIRFSFLFPPSVLMIISLFGAITAFMAAFSALTQSDIKAVLAYSTVSQLGFMMIGVGVGVADFALFHLWTHAFFKAALFLAAGTVIHFMSENHATDPQDMRLMGGLTKYLPVTFLVTVVAGAALAGLPFFSGFLSKEGILSGLLQKMPTSNFYLVAGILGFASVAMTAYYIFRLIFQVFVGASETRYSHKESWLFVKLPLGLLALGSLWIFSSLNPLNAYGWYLSGLAVVASEAHQGELVMLLSLGLSGLGLGFAYALHGKKKIEVMLSGFPLKLSQNGWYLDAAYLKTATIFGLISHYVYQFDKRVVDTFVNAFGVLGIVVAKMIGWGDRYLVDGLINGIAGLSKGFGRLFSRIQAPMVQFQVFFAILILVFVLLWTQYL